MLPRWCLPGKAWRLRRAPRGWRRGGVARSVPALDYARRNDPALRTVKLIELSAAAIAAYHAQDWPAARAAWNVALARADDAPVAKVFMHRIDEFEQQPPGAGWDGSVALEKG